MYITTVFINNRDESDSYLYMSYPKICPPLFYFSSNL